VKRESRPALRTTDRELTAIATAAIMGGEQGAGDRVEPAANGMAAVL
jgi:hypothetical protein